MRPASYCGVAGLKPAFGAVPLDGVVPVSTRLDHAGPIARCVDDLMWLFLAMAEPDAITRSLAELGVTTSGNESGQSPSDVAGQWWRQLLNDLPESFPEKYRAAVARAAGQCSVKKIIESPPQMEIETSIGRS